jgi:hypothetical protein
VHTKRIRTRVRWGERKKGTNLELNILAIDDLQTRGDDWVGNIKGYILAVLHDHLEALGTDDVVTIVAILQQQQISWAKSLVLISITNDEGVLRLVAAKGLHLLLLLVGLLRQLHSHVSVANVNVVKEYREFISFGSRTENFNVELRAEQAQKVITRSTDLHRGLGVLCEKKKRSLGLEHSLKKEHDRTYGESSGGCK